MMRRRRRDAWRAVGRVLSFGLAAVACADEQPAPVESTASAADVAIVAPVVAHEPALPPPPPEPRNTITLQDAGREPRASLAVPVVTGVAQRLVTTVSVRDERRRRRAPPVARVVFDTRVGAVSSDGTKARDLEDVTVVVEEARQEDKAVSKALVAHVREVLTRGGGVTIDPYEVARVAGLEPVQGDLAPARTLAAAFAHALAHLSLPVPAVPVGVGARWTVVRQMSFFGVPTWQHLDCTLVAIDGAQLEIRARVDYTLEATSGHDLPLDLSAVASGEGRATLDARIERPGATPIEMHLRGKVDVRGTATRGEAPARIFAFDLRVDEDYLARPDPRVVLEGAVQGGGLIRGTVAPGVAVALDKKKLPVSPDGRFVFALGRDASRAVLTLTFPDGPSERHVLRVEHPVTPEVTVERPPEDAPPSGAPIDRKAQREARRAAIKARQLAKRASSKVTDVTAFDAGFALPVRASIELPFGVPLDDEGGHGPHEGVAFGARRGAKVVSPGSGNVAAVVLESPERGSIVVIDHGHGLSSTIRGLDPLALNAGDPVRLGQSIGKVHGGELRLSWSMRWRDRAIDPTLALTLHKVSRSRESGPR